MCFDIISNKKQIAKEDIFVLKEMNVSFTKKGEPRYTSLLYCESGAGSCVDELYSPNCVYRAKDKNVDANRFVEIDELTIKDESINAGFHSYSLNTYMNANILCVIPKGTQFYKNMEERVSLDIIFTKYYKISSYFTRKEVRQFIKQYKKNKNVNIVWENDHDFIFVDNIT